MESRREIIEDIQSALLLARRLRYRPIVNQLLDSTCQALNVILQDTQPPAEVKEEQDETASSSSKRTGTKYTAFIADIIPNLRSIYPERSQQERMADAAKLWKRHKHLADHEAILKAARDQLKNDLPIPTTRSVVIETAGNESD
jgi:aspartate carbamoyltransferase catalytic subunit